MEKEIDLIQGPKSNESTEPFRSYNSPFKFNCVNRKESIPSFPLRLPPLISKKDGAASQIKDILSDI